MTDPLEEIDRLARRARQESIPFQDITGQVLARLPRRAVSIERPLLMFAIGYAAVACVTVAFGVSLWSNLNDPLADVFQMAHMVTP